MCSWKKYNSRSWATDDRNRVRDKTPATYARDWVVQRLRKILCEQIHKLRGETQGGCSGVVIDSSLGSPDNSTIVRGIWKRYPNDREQKRGRIERLDRENEL